ncbi:MAG: hypothetical protein WCP85_03220 [Mariniphaga sp.]
MPEVGWGMGHGAWGVEMKRRRENGKRRRETGEGKNGFKICRMKKSIIFVLLMMKAFIQLN